MLRPGKRRQSCEPSNLELEISQNPEEEQEKEEETLITSYPDIKVTFVLLKKRKFT